MADQQPTLGFCAKKRVRCDLLGGDGEWYVGWNDCAKPQVTCPRLPGEGYGKCISVCEQPGHAEEMALRAAGPAARGGMAWIMGVGHICDRCDRLMRDAGLTDWSVVAVPT